MRGAGRARGRRPSCCTRPRSRRSTGCPRRSRAPAARRSAPRPAPRSPRGCGRAGGPGRCRTAPGPTPRRCTSRPDSSRRRPVRVPCRRSAPRVGAGAPPIRGLRRPPWPRARRPRRRPRGVSCATCSPPDPPVDVDAYHRTPRAANAGGAWGPGMCERVSGWPTRGRPLGGSLARVIAPGRFGRDARRSCSSACERCRLHDRGPP
jgi:hypothetical protein